MPQTQHNFVIMQFPDNNSAAFEAYAAVGGTPGLRAAAVVTRDATGQLSVPQSAGGGESGFWTGSLVGALVGVLLGPLGVLLGWSAGAAIGSTYDIDDLADRSDSLSVLAGSITPASNVLLVEADEADPGALDAVANRLGGRTLRMPAAQVLAEVDTARRQAAQATEAARTARREQHKDEFQQKVHGFFHRDAKS